MIRPSPQVRAAIQRTTLPVLVLLAGAIIVLGKADQVLFDSLRTAVTDTVAPVLDAMAQPLNAVSSAVDRVKLIVTTYQENVRLETENEKLLHWQQAALNLDAENQQLRSLLKAVPKTSVSYVTARVIANSGGAFVRMILINAGSEDHVRRGQAAITGEGLVGRLTEVGDRAARVLLITDLNSRIPVTIENTHVAAVLAGDNSERPRLLYLPSADAVKIGDRVVTLGEGGVFPPGLPVGVVAAVDSAGPRVEPYVEMSQLGYVMVVDYGLSNALPQPLPMLAKPNRRARLDALENGLALGRAMALKVFTIPALPRVNNGAARFLPVATTLLAAVISVLPLRIPGYAALTPVFTLMAAYHWTIYRPDLLPPVALFGIGLTEDLLAGSPIGVNALLLLLTRVAVLGYRRYFVNRNFPFVWSGFTLLAAGAMLGLWALHCILDLSLLDLRIAIVRAALTVAMFPLASFMLGRAQRAVMGTG